jgi:hypothetical protein
LTTRLAPSAHEHATVDSLVASPAPHVCSSRTASSLLLSALRASAVASTATTAPRLCVLLLLGRLTVAACLQPPPRGRPSRRAFPWGLARATLIQKETICCSTIRRTAAAPIEHAAAAAAAGVANLCETWHSSPQQRGVRLAPSALRSRRLCPLRTATVGAGLISLQPSSSTAAGVSPNSGSRGEHTRRDVPPSATSPLYSACSVPLSVAAAGGRAARVPTVEG